MKKKIIFLDDDPALIAALKRTFEEKENAWDISYFTDVDACFANMYQSPWDLACVDIRMPHISGVQVLQRLIQEFPGTIRVTFSGVFATQEGGEALNLSHYYITKPIKGQFLIKRLEEILEKGKDLNFDLLKEKILKIKTLPSIPEVYQKVRQELNKIDFSLDLIAN